MIDFNLLIYAGFVIMFIIIILFIFSKEGENRSKFKSFERSIEELMQQNYQLRKEILNLEKSEKSKLDSFESHLQLKIQDEINSKVMPLLNSLKEIEDIMLNFKAEQQDRISFLEEQTKSINRFASPSASTNEKQVVSLYKSGKREHEIAKELRMGLGEVQFILKMNDLK